MSQAFFEQFAINMEEYNRLKDESGFFHMHMYIIHNSTVLFALDCQEHENGFIINSHFFI